MRSVKACMPVAWQDLIDRAGGMPNLARLLKCSRSLLYRVIKKSTPPSYEIFDRVKQLCALYGLSNPLVV